jgi:hypothetical protein
MNLQLRRQVGLALNSNFVSNKTTQVKIMRESEKKAITPTLYRQGAYPLTSYLWCLYIQEDLR